MKKDKLYLDPSQPVEIRVEDLVSRMTLEEKIAQLGSIWGFELLEKRSFSLEKAMRRVKKGIGHIARIAGQGNLSPVEVANTANAIQKFLVENTRLGIPAIVHDECCSGFTARQATCFPQAIGLSSTWDPEIVGEMTSVIKTQMRAVGVHQALSPVLDVTTDPRWGRTEETFGEDPYLISQIGVSYIRGLQGKDLKDGVAATGKHFAGYGNSEGGMNWAPSHIPFRQLHEVFLLPFEAAIKEAHLASIMNAYHEIDGVPCGSSRELLTEILRDQIGFDGVVVSDYYTLGFLFGYHRIARDKKETARLALQAGLDVELPEADFYGKSLHEAIEGGEIEESIVDLAVSRILRMKFLLGLFEDPYVNIKDIPAVFDARGQKGLARKIAQKSMVLLKNKDNILPLKKDIKSIAVIGPNADSVRNLLGDYTYPSQLEKAPEFVEAIGDSKDLEMFSEITHMLKKGKDVITKAYLPIESILEAIKTKVSPETIVHYAKGCEVMDDSEDGFKEAIALAKKSEVAVVVVGGKSGLTIDCTCGESRDRAWLDLPGMQEELVKAIHKTGVPVIVILINGRPLSVKWISEHIPAILEAWLPGEEGAGVVADVIFGDYSPGGKLPISFPQTVGQIPVYYYHKPSGGRSMWTGSYVKASTDALFPFGHGLSYTEYEYTNLKISREEVEITGDVDIGVDIENVGIYAGDEVVQLYVHDAYSNITRPVKELKGFKRVSLSPGEKKRITFRLFLTQLGFYNRDMRFVVEPGTIEVMIGSSSTDIRLSGSFNIGGETMEISKIKTFFSNVRVRDL